LACVFLFFLSLMTIFKTIFENHCFSARAPRAKLDCPAFCIFFQHFDFN
jgi:hypothetical protein